MEVELEPRVKPLSYKVKGMSRESPSQKATHILDSDLRNHWSTGTNTKEWILLELDEPCLLSHVRIYNKSVLEWEISVGLRYKPETFVKVRPRCEAPRRDMMYPMNYTPCRYVRISCLRGNPIAVFFIQLIGVTVTGLEPEFQPVVSYLLPHIISHKQDAHDLYLQLLRDITNRLVVFLPQLEADLNIFSDAAESTIRFLAMLVGTLFPILHIVNERESARLAGNGSDSEVSKNIQPSAALTVSSNFEPRRSRNISPLSLPTSSTLVFRPDTVFLLLRKAYKDPLLGKVCRLASRVLHKLVEPIPLQGTSLASLDGTSSISDEASRFEPLNPLILVDYSNLFGEEFKILDDHWDSSNLTVLDFGAVEEGILHVLYASASQPALCSKLAESCSDFWSSLPFVQALLPALRPIVTSSDQIDDSFSHWKQPFVQHALAQIVATSSLSVYHPLLHACAGYLSSFSPSHAKAACILIDLCSGVLAPWMAQVIAKVDLTVELLEDLIGEIQGARHSFARARAAVKYIVLALSGHMDDIMAKFKEAKHQVLFLVEMLEPFLDPAITPLKGMIAFGNMPSFFLEKQEQNCAIALNVIRAAVKKPAVLPSLEAEWRSGSVSPSILLSILGPHMQLPPDIDLCKFPVSEPLESQSSIVSPHSSVFRSGLSAPKSTGHDDADPKTDVLDMTRKMDGLEDTSLLFATKELRNMSLTNVSASPDRSNGDLNHCNVNTELKCVAENSLRNHFQNAVTIVGGGSLEYSNFPSDYMQLINLQDCELRASEFRRLALDLHNQNHITPEGHDASIDALLLAAECYVNPFFMRSRRDCDNFVTNMDSSKVNERFGFSDLSKILEKNNNDMETVAYLERRRDRVVLQVLLEAAELDKKYQKLVLDGKHAAYNEGDDEVIKLSQQDILSADAITLVRQNQALLCNFLIQRLQREQHSMHEVLLQSLLFLLHSATKLYCPPEDVIDVILKSAEYLNELLMLFYFQSKEGTLHVGSNRIFEVQRRWMLLQKLIIATSGSVEESDMSISVNNSFRFANLIPPLAWIQKIPTFSSHSTPLVRFLGWMAISRNAKQYQKERLFLVSDLFQVISLLSIFADELATVDSAAAQKENKRNKHSEVKQDLGINRELEYPSQECGKQSYGVIYPVISQFFPNMKKQFEAFGETILESVALHLKSLSSSSVPDLLCWFSDLCSWPFVKKEKDELLKGFVSKNARAVILYVLEAIVHEHMEALVPEIPRVVQVLVSLCKTSYCDVSFLDSILRLLKPIISYSLARIPIEEKLLEDHSCLNFESLCFNELFCNIKPNTKNNGGSAEKEYNRALTVFILASVFPDLSFTRQIDFLQSLIFWADFASFEPTSSFHDYLCSFQTVLENCKDILVESLRLWDVIPLKMPIHTDIPTGSPSDDMESHSCFLNDVCNSSFPNELSEKLKNINDFNLNKKVRQLSLEEIRKISNSVEVLISKLNPTIELCWRIHYQLAKKLTLVSAECFMYSRCLSSIAKNASNFEGIEECLLSSNSVDEFPVHWKTSVEGLAEMIVMLQENHCWEVASVILDCLLGVPRCFCLNNVIDTICFAIKSFSYSAPRIAWRLQAEKWLSLFFTRAIHKLHESEALLDLICSLLGHPEPEQRFIAVRHLGKLIGQELDGRVAFSLCNKLSSHDLVISGSVPALSHLVSSTWDCVAVLASSDTSLFLRTRALALLIDFVPFAEHQQLQSLLASADSVFRGLTKLGHPTSQDPLTRLSLALIACVCMHSSAENATLIPQVVWSNIEIIGMSQTGSHGDLEKKICQALCRLKSDGDDAKEILKEVLTSNASKEMDSDIGSMRESILQVVANLNSVQSYFDFFSKDVDEKAFELEEAELELELLQGEHVPQEFSNDFKDWHQLPLLSRCYAENDNRLQQIKESIRALEKDKLREEIVTRRQKKLLVRRARLKYLEEAAIQEAELLQELDRERTTEAEREIERQCMLELERAKTRELRHNLDIEKEKQTQRELQRELEQVESGLRPSRREFSSSTHSSRPRERYRERENGRSSNDGNLRTSSGSLQSETLTANTSMTATPSVVLSGSRSFQGQLPTILQSHDRQDECGSSYEEMFEGSRDSGDTGSVGDPDVVSALEGQPGGFGTAQRHGTRGSKSRQIVERRERDGRREGKWERKH